MKLIFSLYTTLPLSGWPMAVNADATRGKTRGAALRRYLGGQGDAVQGPAAQHLPLPRLLNEQQR